MAGVSAQKFSLDFRQGSSCRMRVRVRVRQNINAIGIVSEHFRIQRHWRAGCGERAYSVIETAKLSGLEPQAYIADVIEKIASDWPASRWDELMPWNWTAEQPPVSPISVKRAA
jgi:hypothetical protein